MTKTRTIVLGLGNRLMSDDAIGLMVVDKLSGQIRHPQIEFQTSEKVGLNLIELIQGYDRAVIIDAIITGSHQPGEVIEFSLDDLPNNPRLRCPHDADFKSAIELGRQTGLKMPAKILILGIEGADNLTFTPNLSPALTSRFPAILAQVAKTVKTFLRI